MFKNILLVCLMALSGGKALAQITPSRLAPAVFQRDLEEKMHPADSSAAAAILYRYGNTWFDIVDNSWVMYTEVFERVKIYKKDGYEYANPEKYYYTGSRKGKCTVTDAYTYNISNGKVVKTALDKNSIFETEINENYSVVKVKMPDVHEGSIIEYRYTIRTPHFHSFRDFKFQEEIPLNHAAYDVAYPGFFAYNVYSLGSETINHAEPKIRVNPKITGEFSRYQTDVKESVYAYWADNVKALKDEPYVNNLDNYTAMVKHELSSYQFFDGRKDNFSTSWEAVAKNIYGESEFGSEVKYNNYFEKDIDAVIAGAKDDKEKMTRVFEFVRNRMTWNKDKKVFCDKGVKKAYEAKLGNSAEINLMLTAMLRYAGLNANPVLVSTRDNGVATYPTVAAYNYVIATVKDGEKDILLDATSKYSQPGILPIRVLNWEGRLIKKNGDNEKIDLMPTVTSREVINLVADITPDGHIKGKARDQYSDYEAYSFREDFGELNEQQYLEKLERSLSDIRISNYKVVNEKDTDKPLFEEYDFTHDAVADIIGDKMYISPLMFYTITSNPFKQEKRQFPVDFVYPHQMKYVISYTIPDGYTVESLPESGKFVMEQGIGAYQFVIQATGNKIQLSVMTQINYPLVSQDYYTTIKDFFQKKVDKEHEKIVLKKS